MNHADERESRLQEAVGKMLAMDSFVTWFRQTAVVWLRWITIGVIGVAIVVVLAFKAANAQTVSAEVAATKIAEVSQPVNTVVQAFVDCMKATGKEKTCRFLADKEAERSAKVAKQAANATKNNWPKPAPIVGYGGYGSYYGGGYYGGSNGYYPVQGGVRTTGCGEGGCNTVFQTGR